VPVCINTRGKNIFLLATCSELALQWNVAAVNIFVAWLFVVKENWIKLALFKKETNDRRSEDTFTEV
jgi:hypothetical protein